MNTQTFFIEIVGDDCNSKIFEIEEILKYDVKGILFEAQMIPSKSGTMSGNEYSGIIQMILTSGAVAAGVKGIFSVLKDYFELKKQQNQLDVEKNKVSIKKTNSNGIIEEFNLSLFTTEEREKLIEFLK